MQRSGGRRIDRGDRDAGLCQILPQRHARIQPARERVGHCRGECIGRIVRQRNAPHHKILRPVPAAGPRERKRSLTVRKPVVLRQRRDASDVQIHPVHDQRTCLSIHRLVALPDAEGIFTVRERQDPSVIRSERLSVAALRRDRTAGKVAGKRHLVQICLAVLVCVDLRAQLRGQLCSLVIQNARIGCLCGTIGRRGGLLHVCRFLQIIGYFYDQCLPARADHARLALCDAEVAARLRQVAQIAVVRGREPGVVAVHILHRREIVVGKVQRDPSRKQRVEDRLAV